MDSDSKEYRQLGGTEWRPYSAPEAPTVDPRDLVHQPQAALQQSTAGLDTSIDTSSPEEWTTPPPPGEPPLSEVNESVVLLPQGTYSSLETTPVDAQTVAVADEPQAAEAAAKVRCNNPSCSGTFEFVSHLPFLLPPLVTLANAEKWTSHLH